MMFLPLLLQFLDGLCEDSRAVDSSDAFCLMFCVHITPDCIKEMVPFS